MELAAAVADPETKRYLLDVKAAEAAYSLLKMPARVGLAILSGLKLSHRSVWVEYDRGRQRRAVQAETNADGSILLRHVARAGPRALGMPGAWGLLDVRTQSPEIDLDALAEENPKPKPKLDRCWTEWCSASFRPMRPDNRQFTSIEYQGGVDWALWDLAVLHVAFAGAPSGQQPYAATRIR